MISFEDYIENIFLKKNIKEAVKITNLIDLDSINTYKKIFHKLATFLFKNKCFPECIKISEAYLRIERDFYIFEILAESYWQRNKLDLALYNYSQALRINPKLVAAQYKLAVLEYRLKKKISKEILNKIEKIALDRKNFSWLRVISYIQYSEGHLENAKKNLYELIDNSDQKYSIDYLTLSDIEKKLGNSVKEKELLKISSSQSFSFNFERKEANTLFVTLSPSSGFILSKYDVDSDKLCFVDNSFTFYMYSLPYITKCICNLNKLYNYEKISITGSSKGGIATIYLADLLQKELPNTVIKAVAFSPQISLYPFNANLLIPSYKSLAEFVDCNILLQKLFKKIKKVDEMKINNKNSITIFYGSNFAMDTFEVKRISENSSFNIVPLNYSGHGSIIPLTIPEGKSKKELEIKYAKLKVDADFAELGGKNIVSIIDEIYNIYIDPKMRLYNFL